MSEIILIIILLLTLLTTFCLYKILDKRGLYFALTILNLITFVLTFKITTVFKMNINVGIVPYISSLSVIYLFLIKYGDKEIKTLEIISLYANITTAILLIIMNYFVPAITETISINMQGTFEYNYKILIIYPIIMFISQLLVVKLFNYVKNIQNNVPICMILTYIITGLIYTVLLYVLSYINIMEVKNSIFIGVSSYIIGLPITIINMIFIIMLHNNKKVIK